MHILIWTLALLALGGWTLLAWATAWVLGLDPALLGDLSGRIGEMPGAAWLDLWLPGWEALAQATLELTRGLFTALGAVGPWLVWGLWGLGTALVLGTAVLASVVVGAARRAMAPKPGATATAGQA